MFRIRGIEVSLHSTFLLLLGYIAWDGWRMGGAAESAAGVAGMLALFACVLMHELGHSFTAQAFGVLVPRITLLPIGGVAEFGAVPKNPTQEMLIAIAGPAVNFALIGVALLFVDFPPWYAIKSFNLSSVELLLLMNLIMGTLNLLPAFPMDGGRVLRALLATRLPYLEATRYAVAIGKILSFGGILVMAFVFQQLLGALMFLFIMIAGELEYRALLREAEAEARWKAFLRQTYLDPNQYPRVQ